MFKKFAAAVVAVILASSLYAYAGDRSGARLGIMAGFTSSSSNAKNLDPSSIGRYHFGVTAEIPIAFGFAVQPSVLYQAKGTKLSDANIDNFKLDAKVSYIEIPVQVQWGPDLMAFRPYVFAEPFIGYGLHSKVKGSESDILFIQIFQRGGFVPLGVRFGTRRRNRCLEDAGFSEILLELRFSLF